MSAVTRHNVTLGGSGEQPMIFAHGYGCDQSMWRFVAPAFEASKKVILFDHVGHGGSSARFDPVRYGTLQGYADDVLAIVEELRLERVIFVGHSVSAMIGVLAAAKWPDRFDKLVMIGPSPCYIDDGDYVGGFSRRQLEELLDFLDSNHLGWSAAMAPVIMDNRDRPELADELTNSFCRTSPEVAKHFARVTFFSDNRADLGGVETKALVLQCSDDVIAPEVVGRYVHNNLAGSRFVLLRATGHCPHLSAPEETIAAIKDFLGEPVSRSACS